MKDYKLIAFDMDGTLLNDHKKILPSSLMAIGMAAAAGKETVLSTGRCLPELEDYLSELEDVRYVIGISGALVYDLKKKKALAMETFAHETVCALLQRLREYDVIIHLLSVSECLVDREKEKDMAKYQMGVYQHQFDTVCRLVDDVEGCYLAERFPVMKINCYAKSEEERQTLRSLLADLPMTMVNAEGASLECSPQGIDKGKGLLELCDCLGIDPSETIAVGDGENDLAILKTAGFSVGMGNAVPAVRQVVDAVVSDNEHDGCKEAIERFLLGEQK